MTHNTLNYALFLVSALTLYGVNLFLAEVLGAVLKRDRDPDILGLAGISLVLLAVMGATAFAGAAGVLGFLLP